MEDAVKFILGDVYVTGYLISYYLLCQTCPGGTVATALILQDADSGADHEDGCYVLTQVEPPEMTKQLFIDTGSQEDAEPYYKQILNHLTHAGGLDLTIGLGVGEVAFDTAVETGCCDAVYDYGHNAYQGVGEGGLQIGPYHADESCYEPRNRTEPAIEQADKRFEREMNDVLHYCE